MYFEDLFGSYGLVSEHTVCKFGALVEVLLLCVIMLLGFSLERTQITVCEI